MRASKEKSIKNVSRQFHFRKMFIILVFILFLDIAILCFYFIFIRREKGGGGQ